MQTKEQVLQASTVEGNIVKLPAIQLERILYTEVAKALEKIGGKWKGGKVMGFVFPYDPTGLLSQIAKGEKRNLKKEFQFFPTPPDLAEYLAEIADISSPDLLVLEPSAGQGAIVSALLKREPGLCIHAYELMDLNREALSNIKDCIVLGTDYLSAISPTKFDRIIANPPFEKNQDVTHIQKMYSDLKKGGRLVTIASNHWRISTNKIESEFRDWLKSLGAEINDLKSGTFKDSGTMVSSCIIIINKER